MRPVFETGAPSDFTTDLAVYQDGREIARKTIRVNDPLSVAGFTFHQNGFGPAPHIVLRSAAGAVLWDAPVPIDTMPPRACPTRRVGVPGRDMGLKLLLDRQADGAGVVIVIPYRIVGTAPDGQPIEELYPGGRPAPRRHEVSQGLDLSSASPISGSSRCSSPSDDPGQGLVWVAFGLLIAGITITFYRPRRRVWARAGSRWTPRRSSGGRTATWTSSGSSGACSTSSSPLAAPPEPREGASPTAGGKMHKPATIDGAEPQP